jgi:hypothetical protein
MKFISNGARDKLDIAYEESEKSSEISYQDFQEAVKFRE